jgi:hypothetical protein
MEFHPEALANVFFWAIVSVIQMLSEGCAHSILEGRLG